MSSSGRRRKKRLHTKDLSPTAEFESLRVCIGIGATLCLLGMVFLYGGTQFWASVPFLIPLILLLGLHQSIGLFQFGKGGSFVQLPNVVWIWGLILLYILIRAVVNPLVPYQVWTSGYQVGIGLLVFILFTDLGVESRFRDVVWIMLVIVAILQAMWAVQLYVNGSNMVLWLPRPDGYGMRASGTFICPNHFAHLLQMAGICAVSVFLLPRKSIAIKLISGFALIWILFGLVLSQSRSGLLGFGIGSAGMVFLKLARRGWKRAVVGILLSGAIGGLLVGLIWVLYPPFLERLAEAAQGDPRFSQYWPDTWNMIKGEGFWGVGPGVFRHLFDQYREHFSSASLYLHYAHNEYLHILAEYGWLMTGLIFGTLVWSMCKWIRQAFRVEDERSAMIPIMQLGLLGGSLVHAVFDFNFHITANMLVLIMLLGILQGNAQAARLSVPCVLTKGQSRWVAGMTVAICLVLLPLSVALFMGSYAEYRIDVADNQQDTESRGNYAAQMRKWTPMHWRGWVESARANRVSATFHQDPVTQQDLIRKSRRDYEMALKRNPVDPIAQIGLVELAALEGDYERAVEEIDVLIGLSPYDTAIWIRKGILLQEVERYEESLEVFRHVRKMRPGRDEQVELNIRYLRGKIRK